MSEIRQNQLTGEWVIIAPERAKRGGNLLMPAQAPESTADCPFCPGNEASANGERYRVNDAAGRWMLRSIVNKFSVLSAEGAVQSERCAVRGVEKVNAVGPHEVLIETPEHHLTVALCSVEHVARILGAYRDRFQAFYADPRVQHVIVFKNHGADAGASQQHPHSQIVGLPIVPGQIVERIARAERFFAETGRCLACTIIAQERALACRIVAENSAFVAFLPYAALSPYHLWIFPKTHGACFSAQPVETLNELAEIMRQVLLKLHGMLANPAFNLVIRSLGPREQSSSAFHWYLSIVPRVNKVAGFELGTGMYVNPSLPEHCAEALRAYRE